MKTVRLKLNKVTIGEYYAQLDQVNFRIHYNDGTDQVLSEQISITDPQKHVAKWLRSIRTSMKNRHSENNLDDDPLAGALIINYTQETDVLHDKIEKFVTRVKERIRSAKLNKTSYWDLEKQIKSMTLILKD